MFIDSSHACTNWTWMVCYNSHILVSPTLYACISLQHASKSYLKEKKKVFVFAFFIKPTCRLTEDHFRNRHSSMTWRKNQISLLTGSSPRRRLLMTKKRSSHGVMIMVEPVRLSALPSPPAPLHLDPSSLPGSWWGAAAGDGSMEPGCAFPAFYKKATAGPAADWGLYSYKSRDLGQI